MKLTMRKLTAWLACFVMLCSILPAGLSVAAENTVELMVNGGFETGNFDTGWVKSWYAPSIVTSPVHSGTYAMKTTQTTKNYQTMIKSADLAVTTNTDYSVSFWYYYEGTNAAPSFYMYVKNGNTNVKQQTVSVTTPNTWNQVTFTFNSGAYTSVTLFLQNKTVNDGGTYYFDDVSVLGPGTEPEPEPDPEPEVTYANLATNGDFETGDKTGWAANSNSSIATSPVHGGSYSYKSVATTSNWQTQLKSNAIPVEANKDYTISFWYYYDGSNAAPSFSFYIKDGGNSKNLLDARQYPAAAGTWYNVEKTFNTGSYTSVLILAQNRTASDGGVYYFDDFFLYDPSAPIEPEPEPDPEPEGPLPVPSVPNNLTINSNFEAGSTSGWKVYGSTAASADAAYTGEYGVAISGTNAYSSQLNQLVAVEANEPYIVSFWYKAVTNWTNFQIKDGSNSGSELTKSTLNATNWTYMSYEVSSAEGALFLNFYHNGTTDENLVYVDDIQVTPAPLVKNGGFETGTNANWTVYQNSTVATAAKYNGNYGMKLTGTGNWGSMANQNVTVEAGKTYVVSAWVKVVATGANIKIQDGGSSGATLASGSLSNTNWTRVAHVVTPSTNLLHVNFHSTGSGTAETVYLDDVAVEEIPDSGLLENGTFEVGNTNSWTTYQSTVLSTDAAYQGYYGVNLKGAGNWNGMLHQDFTTVVGKKYNFSAYMKTISNGANVQIKDAATNTTIETVWFTNTAWSRVSIDFVATGTTTRINFSGSGNGTAEDVYVDNIRVIELKDPSFDGYIYNGDFEAGSLTHWTSGGFTELSPDAAYTGEYGCKILGTGNWNGLLSQEFNLEAGKTYKISFWYKGISNGVNFILTGKQDNKALTSEYIHYKASGGGKWVLLEKTFKSAYNTTATIAFSGSGKETPDEMWIDDMVVECLSGAEMDRNDNTSSGGASIRDTADDQRGLAFRFFVNALNTELVNGNQLVPNTGSIKLYEYADILGDLVQVGAVVTNDSTVAADLTLASVDGKKTIDIPAKYLLDWEADTIGFAVRIINIPEANAASDIFVRPYYTYNLDGTEVTIYGDVVDDNYAAVESIRRTKRVLVFGDAASYDSMDSYLYDALKSAAYDQVILGNLADGTYAKNDDNGEWVTTTGVDNATAMADEDWQYIVVTDAALLDWVNANKPADAKVLYYASDIPDAAISGVDAILPMGTALANLNTVLPEATDVQKEFATVMTWFVAITGENYDLVTAIPDEAAGQFFHIARAAAHAVYNPYAVSDLTETTILAGGDYQPQNWEDGPPIVQNLLAGVQTGGFGLFDGFFAIGDYAHSTGHDVATQGVEDLDEVISDVAYGNRIYSEGNHDAPSVNLIAPTGNNDPVGGTYGLFVINESDYNAYGGGGAAVASKLNAYFNEKKNDDTWGNKPIFVLCHVPLHYSRRTPDESCAVSALPIVNALNAAGDAGMNVIFLFGHNHSGDYDAYIGGGSIYLKKGDTILVPDTESAFNAPSEVTLKFTYLNAGYINYYSDHGSGVDGELTMTTFRILADGSVVISRYDANGLHNLKAEGKMNALDEANAYIAGALDTTVYESSRIVTATSDEPYEE